MLIQACGGVSLALALEKLLGYNIITPGDNRPQQRTKKMHTFPELIKDHKLESTSKLVDSNPHMPWDGEIERDHWSVTITHPDQSMQMYYSMGIGHRELPKNWKRQLEMKLGTLGLGPIKRYTLAGEAKEALKQPTAPSLADVLNCLASDCRSVQGRFFSEWAAECGYSSDSIQAKKTYDVCCEQAIKFLRLLGRELYETMINDTEWM